MRASARRSPEFRKDAAAIVSGETGQPRRRVYARALQLAAGWRNTSDCAWSPRSINAPKRSRCLVAAG